MEDNHYEVGFWQKPKIGISGLSSTERDVIGILWTRRNGDNTAWPGQEYLAHHAGLKSTRQIRRVIAKLVELDYLTVRRRGQGRTNEYDLNIEKTMGLFVYQSSKVIPKLDTDGHTRPDIMSGLDRTRVSGHSIEDSSLREERPADGNVRPLGGDFSGSYEALTLPEKARRIIEVYIRERKKIFKDQFEMINFQDICMASALKLAKTWKGPVIAGAFDRAKQEYPERWTLKNAIEILTTK